jgi:hypothetical protein
VTRTKLTTLEVGSMMVILKLLPRATGVAEESIDADVKGEVSGEVSTNSSPKIKLYNSIIDRYNKSKPSEKNVQFQHAIYTLIVLKDDQATKGIAQIIKDQGRLTNII